MIIFFWQKALPTNLTMMNPTTTDLFHELVDNLCHALTAEESTSTQSTTITPPSTPSPPVCVASPIVNPATYSGLVEGCNGFQLQCSLALEIHPPLRCVSSPLRELKYPPSYSCHLDEHWNILAASWASHSLPRLLRCSLLGSVRTPFWRFICKWTTLSFTLGKKLLIILSGFLP